MSIAAFLHGYPPVWSMGGEISTHRTLRVLGDPVVYTATDEPYRFDGVDVRPLKGLDWTAFQESLDCEPHALFAHSSLSVNTVRLARRLRVPSILAVHAPPRFANDLKKAWPQAKIRLYNTEAARKDWRDPRGWLLHPPVGPATPLPKGPRDAWTLTSSLLNKGAGRVLELARRNPDQRVIIVRSPAHSTHGAPDFEEEAAQIPNLEVWDRVHPAEMGRLWAETRLLLVPSRYETYGLAALEAAWHGIPSVHVHTPHVLEGIGHGARLLNTTSVDELAWAVKDVEDNFSEWANRALDRVQTLAERENRELEQFAAAVAGLRRA